MNVMEMFSLKGKVAVVTGGYGHLGKAMSEALHDAGATVIVAGRSEEKFNSVFKAEQGYCFIETDISKTKSIQNCFEKTKKKFSRIDILINNAVYMAGGGKKPEEITDEDWAICMDGVSGSVFKCIREVIPYMHKRGGSIINISSMYGVVSPDFSLYETSCSPFFNPVNYGAAKAAVVQMTKYWATYLAKENIKVNCISPGTFPTQKVQENQEFVERLTKKNPANRIGLPEDIKGTIVFLASDASKYIIGQNLMVDGGWTIW